MITRHIVIKIKVNDFPGVTEQDFNVFIERLLRVAFEPFFAQLEIQIIGDWDKFNA